MDIPASQPATGTQIQLTRGAQRAVVTEVGATLRSWSVEGRELLDTFGEAEPGTGYRGKVLAPWPNRLCGGRYAFGGAAQQAPLNEPERGHAVHGLVGWVPWQVVQRSGDAVRFAHRLYPQPGYPFLLDLEVRYVLGADGLEIALEARNAGASPAPFGTGIHPYIAAGPVDDARLRLPAATRLEVDDRLIPTGARAPVEGGPYDFREARPVGATELDSCFTDLVRDADGLARARLEPADPGAPAVTVWMDERFGFLQAYTADADPDPARRRRSVALEPMTCAPDAFNSGDGLAVLDPGGRFEGRCGLAAG